MFLKSAVGRFDEDLNQLPFVCLCTTSEVPDHESSCNGQLNGCTKEM